MFVTSQTKCVRDKIVIKKMTNYLRKIKKKDITDTGPILDRYFTGRRSLHNGRCIGGQSTDISGDYLSNVGQL